MWRMDAWRKLISFLFVFSVSLIVINGADTDSTENSENAEEESRLPEEIPQDRYLMNELDYSWPDPMLRGKFGQIGGVAEDTIGNVFVFHRSERVWDTDDFNEKYSYVRAKYGPIQSDTIVILDKKSKVLAAFGRNMFYLPHGISLDYEGNVWVTDVALHQVKKFEFGKRKPSLSLGKSLIPGDDDAHFCQPTSVAVARNGEFFVADGYCNSRIMKFSPNGTLLRKWGREREHGETLKDDHLSIPHSITLNEERDLVCVADRENERVQCYKAGLKDNKVAGKFAFNITNPEFGKVYAVNYNPAYDILLILGNDGDNSRGYIYSMATHKLVDKFFYPSKMGFGDGHSLSSSDSGSSFVVGGLTKVCPDLEIPNCEEMEIPLYQNLFRFNVFNTDELAAIV